MNNLEEKELIKTWEDLSEENTFKFMVHFNQDVHELGDYEIKDILKLNRSISENFTCIDENNSIREFKSIYEIVDAFIEIRKEYYKTRKENILKNIAEDLKVSKNKLMFLKAIIDNTLVIYKKPKDELYKLLEAMKLDKRDDSYDYLLHLPIVNMTVEYYNKNVETFKAKAEEYKTIQSTTPEQLWIKDLEILVKELSEFRKKK